GIRLHICDGSAAVLGCAEPSEKRSWEALRRRRRASGSATSEARQKAPVSRWLTGSFVFLLELLGDLGDSTCAHGTAALADGEAEAVLHGDRLDQLDLHVGVVARHHHLAA